MRPAAPLAFLACAVGFLTGVRALLGVDFPDLVPLLAVDPIPIDPAGISWTDHARWPTVAREAATASLVRTIASLLLAACAAAAINAVILLAEASDARRPELAIRSSVGASPARLARSLAREVLLALAWGVALGLVAGAGAGAALRAAWPHATVDLLATSPWPVPVDLVAGTALLVMLVLSAQLTGVRRIARPSMLSTLLRSGMRSTSDPGALFIRRALAAAHVAISGAIIISVVGIASASRTVRAGPAGGTEPFVSTLSHESTPDWGHVLETLADVPGVEAESLSAPGSLLGLGVLDVTTTECGACARGLFPAPLWNTLADHHVVSAGYFESRGFTIAEGRTFGDVDTADSEPVALVNRRLAWTAFEDAAPIGKRLQIGSGFGRWYRVIGVVEDHPLPGLGTSHAEREAVYVNVVQNAPRTARLVVTGDEASVARAIGDVRRAGYSATAPRELGAWRADQNAALAWARAVGWVLSVVSIVVAMLGLRVIVLQISQRRGPDLDIRRALGATRTDLLRSVIAERLRIWAWGVAGFVVLGTLAAAFIERASGTAPPSLATWVLVAALIGFTCLGAGTGIGTVERARGLQQQQRPQHAPSAVSASTARSPE